MHLIIGAGPVGSATALELAGLAESPESGGPAAPAGSGQQVTVVTRSGAGPRHPLVRLLAADATDADLLTALARDATAIYNCANPAYHRWAADWPPLAASLLTAAERTGAVLVTMSNLYGYGLVDAPLTEDLALAAPGAKGKIRAEMWERALAAHQAGRARVTEARASDFYGPGVRNSHVGERVVPKLLAGRRVRVIGDPDAPHSWTYVGDVARTLVRLGADERAWGRPWHVPTAEPLSQRQFASAVCAAAEVRAPDVAAVPPWAMRVTGWVSPLVRELEETTYQFDRPFIVNSAAAQGVFGIGPTALATGIAATVAWWRRELGRPAAQSPASASSMGSSLALLSASSSAGTESATMPQPANSRMRRESSPDS